MSDNLGKYEDAGLLVPGGRIDNYWDVEKLHINTEKVTDDNVLIFQDFLLDTSAALSHFKLRSIEYGNWMNQSDRANFLYGAMLSLFHLAHLFGLSQDKMGLNGRLSISLGARGQGGAAAHYEAMPYSVINITKPKGFGSFAHEYGHAIDNIISYYSKTHQSFVSGGRSTRKRLDQEVLEKGNWFEQQMELLLNKLFWEENGGKTAFHQNIEELPEYWNRRNEVFARTFEAFITYKMNEKGWVNHFLSDAHYSEKYYPSTTLLEKVEPLLEDIIRNAFQVFAKHEPLNGISSKTTIKRNASLKDTLDHMKHIVLRDYETVEDLAFSLKGDTVAQTSESIWNWMRANTTYRLDEEGTEQLRTPLRSLNDRDLGIDCDDYTILISCILMNLEIPHQFRVAAYNEKGRFQHIYPVAFDNSGNAFVIDVVPEIPHFNYEAQPIKDLKTITIMELQELSGLNNEAKNELIDELNQPFSLSGIEENDNILEGNFLEGFKEVSTEDKADIVLNGRDDAIDILERGMLAEVNKARNILIQEIDKPTALSEAINVKAELTRMNELMSAWEDDGEREELLEEYVRSTSSYKNFFKALLFSINKLEDESLDGFEDDEPIYLARVSDVDLTEIFDDSLQGLGFLKKFFKKVGSGIKKVVKAVVKYNPASIAIRAAIRLVLRTNLFKIGSRLIYGYLTEAQANAQNLNIAEWRKVVSARKKAENFYAKLGGKTSAFKAAIVKGKAASKTGLSLGVVATGTTAAASGFIVFAKKILAAINPANLFKKIKKTFSRPKSDSSSKAKTSSSTFADENDFTNTDNTPAMRTTNPNEEIYIPPSQEKPSLIQRAKGFFTSHKKKIMVVGIGAVVALVSLFAWKKIKQKKKRSLAGAKAARTRKRNAKKALGSTRTRRAKKRPALRGSTTIIKVPSKSIRKARATKRSNANRLSLMHKKAKQLQKKHPNTKYSNLLKKAAKLI